MHCRTIGSRTLAKLLCSGKNCQTKRNAMGKNGQGIVVVLVIAAVIVSFVRLLAATRRSPTCGSRRSRKDPQPCSHWIRAKDIAECRTIDVF